MDIAQKLIQTVIAVGLFAGIMVVILLLAGRVRRRGDLTQSLAFVLPALFLIAVGLVYPAILTTRQSFVGDGGGFSLENYQALFQRPELLTVLRNTAIWVLVAPVLATLIGLIYAVLVDRARFEAFAKGLIFMPLAISLVGASIIWKFVYEYRPDQLGVEQIGLLNQLFVWLGLEPQQIILNAPQNTLYLIVILIWVQAGFAMTVLSAAIKAIPQDIIEAGRLDGLYGVKMFRYVTVPSIRPALVVVLTAISITTLKVFDIVRTMTGGQYGTSVVANEFYVQSFRYFNFELGAALAMVLFVLVLPIVAYNVRQMRKADYR